ncbi:hypothetical protein KHA94_13925 [Bacillus sp. FJAT-49705]|uniref:Uncharacterized protein n=1 Tax=Cytobacillus citreus TaxID=2833586 RepID=A0ABS5NVW8_9BACI|nr:hypothetical protein [Cytobacillus citreus]MBS4191283.1 hypothetical protein [Cytobacillus citreus]
MKIIFAVEANNIIEEVPEFMELLVKETKVFDFHDLTFMFETYAEASHAEELLREADLLENHFELLLVDNGEKGETFFDFGIETPNRTYLLKDLLCSFSIIGGDYDSIRMAVLQVDEHLIYKTVHEKETVYFVESHLIELVKGIADAYDIKVSFFELDKQVKKI